MKDKFDIIHYHDKYDDIDNISKKHKCVPIYRYISCGYPKFLDDDLEGYLEIPFSLIGPGEFFVLRTKGDSMIDAGINDGDLVLIKKQESAENGQIVVALYNGEVSLKKLFFEKQNKKYVLHPENPRYKNILLDDVEVLGVAIKVIKDL